MCKELSFGGQEDDNIFLRIVCKLRDKVLLSKIEVFHLIFTNDVKARIIINDEMIIFGVVKVFWILCESWLKVLEFLVFFCDFKCDQVSLLYGFHEFLC